MQLSVRGNQNEGFNRVRAMPTTVKKEVRRERHDQSIISSWCSQAPQTPLSSALICVITVDSWPLVFQHIHQYKRIPTALTYPGQCMPVIHSPGSKERAQSKMPLAERSSAPEGTLELPSLFMSADNWEWP